MVQESNRLFSNGQTVWFADGRQGTITSAAFNDDGGFWEYQVTGLDFPQPEFLLLGAPPPADVEGPPEPVIVPAEEEEEVIVIQPIAPPEITGDDEPVGVPTFTIGQEVEIRRLVGDVLRLRGIEGIGQAEIDQGQAAAVRQSSLILDANLQALRENVLEPLQGRVDGLESQFLESESTVATTLSEIEQRRLEQELAADDGEGSGVLGFFRNVGGILRSPVDWFIDKILGFLIGEWLDGNSR